MGYRLVHKWHLNILSLDKKQTSCNIALIAFMDDSHWITDSIQGMNLTLSTTTSFNQLNNIKTNENKAVLLSTAILDKNGHIVFMLQDQLTITIQPLPLQNT